MASKTPRAPRLKVAVTQEMIDDAVARDSSHCMIADAVKAAYPDAHRVAVDVQTIRFSDRAKRRRYTYLTPRLAQVYVVKWDQGIKPEPFEVGLRNGQVSAMADGVDKADKKLTAAQQRQRREAAAKGRAKLSKATLKFRQGKGPGRDVPDRIGGKTPPTTPLSRRRAFGLRGLEH